jgi:hypothetical protein
VTSKPTLQTHIAKAVGAAPVQELMDGLKDLVLLRLRRPQRTTQPTPDPIGAVNASSRTATTRLSSPTEVSPR